MAKDAEEAKRRRREIRREMRRVKANMAFCQPTTMDHIRDFFSREGMSRRLSWYLTKVLHLLLGPPTPPAEIILSKYTFPLPVDLSLPSSPGCFEACANEYHAGQLSYKEFLDAALAPLDTTSPVRHPEDESLANLAKLSSCGSMGPVAAAIKLCMLSDSDSEKPVFSQDTIDLLHAMQPSSTSSDHHSPTTTLAALPPLHLQVIILAALAREMPTLAIQALSTSASPPPSQSLFNLRDSATCPAGGRHAYFAYHKYPPEFWTAAVRARWVSPYPEIADAAAHDAQHGGPLLRALLDAGLDVTLPHPNFEHHYPMYKMLLPHITQKQDDASLLRDILSQIPPKKKLKPDLLRLVVTERAEGGVEMLTLLLDRGLDIDYRVTTRVPLYVQRDPWGSDYYVQERMTALHTAAKKGNRDAVRFLISRGAKLDVLDFHKDTARDLAVKEGHHEVVEIFDQVGDPQCDEKKTGDTK